MSAYKNKITIFDTTLRDGQQCPGAGMTHKENLEYAHLARALKIDILEAGFPSASDSDFNIVKDIAEELSGNEDSPIIAGLCQLREEQVHLTIKALESAIRPGKAKMHTYVPVDPHLMDASLGAAALDKEKIVKKVYDYCKIAVDEGLSVEFSPEGYSRQGENFNFVTDLIRAAVEAGADTINCPDTIGGASRFQREEFFVHKMNEHARIISSEYPESSIIWSAHCHNDFGLAVENSIAAITDGPARQVEGCLNGVGERAGNASLEQVIMIINEFGEAMNPDSHYSTNIQIGLLQEISDFVDKHMLVRQPHFPHTGRNAARHSSGGHTNAVLKNPTVYQPYDPARIGKEVSLAFGPLSGGNHAKSIIENCGYVCEDKEKASIGQFIKDSYKLRRKGITDEELLDAYLRFRCPIIAEDIDYNRSHNISTFTFEGRFFADTGKITESHEGQDSTFATLKTAIDKRYSGLIIKEYHSQSQSEGARSESCSFVVVTREDGKAFEGKATDHDITKSAMIALINAVNDAYIDQYFKKKK